MKRIDLFKKHLDEKRAVKVIAGIDNFDLESVRSIILSADKAGASAVDICADEKIIMNIRELTDLPIFVSSINPSALARAVELGADAIELGNFDVLYKTGKSFSAKEVLELTKETLALLKGQHVFFSVTIPGEIDINEQISLARELETLGIDLIQTEGHFSKSEQANGVRGLMERVELTISNTIELVRNVDLPVMTATGINPTTAPFAFAAGASAIGCGSCISKLNSEIAMCATIQQLVESASKNTVKIPVSA